jgi:CTP:molybdopterin cytidylyltransferase MocA
MIAALILAAGRGTRMRGIDKLLEPVDGQPLLRHQVEIAQHACNLVVVMVPQDGHPRAQALAGTNAQCIAVQDPLGGLGDSLRDGVAALPEVTGFFVVLSDMPDITKDDYNLVAQTLGHKQIVRPLTASGAAGHPIYFDAIVRPEFAFLSGDTGAQSIIARDSSRVGYVQQNDNRARRDLDTPEDWAAWRRETGR